MESSESSEGDGGEKSKDDGEEDSLKAVEIPFTRGKDPCVRDGGRNRVCGPRAQIDLDRREGCRGKEEQVSEVRNSFSLFVDNIPPNTSREGIREIFGRFGRVSSIFLSRKRRKGSRNLFGFVRFLNKHEAEEARGNVDGMRIGDQVLFVNIPRFDRKSRRSARGSMTGNDLVDGIVSEGGSASKMGMRPREFYEGEAIVLPSMFQVGCSISEGLGGPGGHYSGFGKGKQVSYAQMASVSCGPSSSAKIVQGALESSSGVINDFVGNSKEVNIGQAVINLPGGKSGLPDRKSGFRKRILATIKVSDWDRCAAIALLRDGMLFSDMRSIILETCSYVRTISLIKDNYVLIMFQSSNHCGLAIEHGFWSHWFYYIKAWNDGIAEDVNTIWVECRGIPFCAWNESTFKAIASVWGSIVEVDPDTIDMVHLSSARIRIATCASAIEDIIDLQVGDNTVVVSVSSSNGQSMCSDTKRHSLDLGQQQICSSSKTGTVVLGKPNNSVNPEMVDSNSRAIVDQSLDKAEQDVIRPFSENSLPVSVLYGEDFIKPAQGAGKAQAVRDVARAVPSGTVVHAHAQGDGLTLQGKVGPNYGDSMFSGVKSNGSVQREGKKCEDSGVISTDVPAVVNKFQSQLQGLGSLSEDLGEKVPVSDDMGTGCSVVAQSDMAVYPKSFGGSRLEHVKGPEVALSGAGTAKVGDVQGGAALLGSKLDVFVIDSDEGDHRGIAGNVVPVATLIKEYNKELVIPAKFLSMSGYINISKAGFYAVCNRLIEVIDEILDMSSYMGFPCSTEVQRGIKEVMTGRQTRALGMIMDSL